MYLFWDSYVFIFWLGKLNKMLVSFISKKTNILFYK